MRTRSLLLLLVVVVVLLVLLLHGINGLHVSGR
jgi:hypothetical protein